ncbi:MAG TPA: S8 family peptidase [Verrucomicrobiae bacterium]|jgi:subtilisin family serine protease|nr:S8 family peptidase [Verrucomicrobiae bacterium]
MFWELIFSRRGRSVARNLKTTPGFSVLTGIFCVAMALETSVTANPEFRADQILVQPKKNSAPDAMARFHTLHRSRVVKSFPNLHGLQVLQVSKNETVASLIAEYQQSGLVDFAEPDYVIHTSAAPNDPQYEDGTLWWLNNIGQSGGTPDADIDAPEAWDVLNSASNVVVAVIDTGIRYTHEDLAANIWTNPIDGSHGFNAIADNNDPNDDNGHGTLVAGVLGAVGNNGKGIVGVAWRVQMMACKCIAANGAGNDSGLVACIDFARTNGARIINASLDSTGASLAVSNAVEAAREAGIIFVASAGNGIPPTIAATNIDMSPHYPACYPMDNIVSVAYTTRDDVLAPYSNYGATNVDLAAPGDQVYSTYYLSDNYYFPPIGFGYNIAGSSFSAACVSGTFALMIAKYPNEDYHQIINRVLKAVDPLPTLAGKCVTGGRLNLWKALSPPINLVSIPAANGLPFQLRLNSGANRECVIQSSADLSNWLPLYTNVTDTNGVFDFLDTDSINAGQRFYRAVAAP